MNVHKLLQTELWSKKTTRKMLVWSSVVFGALAVGFIAVREIELHWLTPGERKAARVALESVDGLQDFVRFDDPVFEDRDKDAKAKVELATQAALTTHDASVAFTLEAYLSETEMDRDEIQMAVILWQRHLPVSSPSTEFGKRLQLTGTEMRGLTRVELHKALN
jgi:hypothetical protein